MSEAKKWWRFIRMPVFVLIAAYVALVMVALFFADSMIHHPEMGSRRAPEGLRKLRGPDGRDIAVLHLPNPQARFTIWFFHGNAEDLGDVEPFLQQLHAAGFAVFAFDYPGYGLSEGRPSEAALYAAARTARNFLRNELRVPSAKTILYGRSVGGGPAVQMATEEPVGGLVVQSGFMSAFRVMTRWPLLPFDQFKNLAKMPRVLCPVLVMHGWEDEVVAFYHGEALFNAAREPKRSCWVAGAGHNDFREATGDNYWRALRDFSDLCAREAKH
jgi:abhydrolase domain-containing protein 17